MSIAVSYIYNTKEQGVQTYLINRLFTFPTIDVDFYIPHLLNMYIYIKDVADLLNPYFRYRCCNSVDFSLRCAWLLESFINDNKKESRKVSYAIKLHKLIVSDRLKPATDCLSNKFSSNNNKTALNNIRNGHGNGRINEELVSCTSPPTIIQPPSTITNNHKTHSRTRSDITGIQNSFINSRSLSLNSLKSCIGDLNSGRAFDNNCICFDILSQSNNNSQKIINGFNDDTKIIKQSSNNNLIPNDIKCVCNAPRLAPELEFTKALVSIGKKLVQLPTKELKSRVLFVCFSSF
jgi:hypothetical protein